MSHFYSILVYVLVMKESKPSQTAVWIAKGLLYLNQKGRLDGFDEQSIALWRAVLARLEPLWLVLLQNRGYQYWFELLENFTIPGLFAHYAARKSIISKFVNQALEDQVEQVIVLAAGFDTLVQQTYAKYPKVQFLEIDHPATQEIKKQAFIEINPITTNVIFIAADFEKQTLKTVLEQYCDPDKKTLIVAEGITMYFFESDVKSFFKDIHDYFKNKLQLIFTFMEKRPNGSIQFANASFIVNWWLALQNENFRWGIEPKLLDKQFLAPLGFVQRALLDPLLGEWVCLCDVNHD